MDAQGNGQPVEGVLHVLNGKIQCVTWRFKCSRDLLHVTHHMYGAKTWILISLLSLLGMASHQSLCYYHCSFWRLLETPIFQSIKQHLCRTTVVANRHHHLSQLVHVTIALSSITLNIDNQNSSASLAKSSSTLWSRPLSATPHQICDRIQCYILPMCNRHALYSITQFLICIDTVTNTQVVHGVL